MNEHRIRFEGAAAAALTVATMVADVDGVDLTASEPPVPLQDGRVRLDLRVQAAGGSIEGALDEIRSELPADSTIELDPR